MNVLNMSVRARSAVLAIIAAFLAVTASSATIAAQEETDATGSLVIVNVACTNLEEATANVLAYDGAPSGTLPDIDPECTFASGTYTVYPFGVEDDAEAVALSTDESGTAVADLPVTDGQSPHLIVEDATGASATFEITAGNTTNVEFFGPAAQDDTGSDDAAAATPDVEADVVAEGDDEATAEGDDATGGAAELPSTGQGQSSDGQNVQMWLAIAVAALLVVAAGTFTVQRRRS